jgi:L-ascorbate metabolism protein UlaG (beta-lactamase superfamily)
MKNTILIIAIIINSIIALNAQEEIDIIYIANDGFLISGKSQKVLIDALPNNSFGEYDVPSDKLRKQITKGKPPFEKIDLYLVTHSHSDHFYAPYITDFLKMHKETKFVSSPQVNDQLSGASSINKQITTINQEVGGITETTVAGIPLKIYRTKHAGDSTGNLAVNLAYLMTVDNFKVLHIGDGPFIYNQSEFESFHLENEHIDILFLAYFSLADYAKNYINEVIKPRYIIAKHIPPKEVRTELKKFPENYSNGFVYSTPMELKTFTK